MNHKEESNQKEKKRRTPFVTIIQIHGHVTAQRARVINKSRRHELRRRCFVERTAYHENQSHELVLHFRVVELVVPGEHEGVQHFDDSKTIIVGFHGEVSLVSMVRCSRSRFIA